MIDSTIVGTEEQVRVRQILADYNIPVVLDDRFMVLPREELKAGKNIDPPRHKANAASSLLMHLGDGNTQIDYGVRYQLEVCISQGYLHEHNITEEFHKKLREMDPTRAQALLEKVADQRRRIFDPMVIFAMSPRVTRHTKIPRYCALQRAATVTPTTIYFATPVAETSNRIIRQYRELEDRFLRVKFTDENGRGQIRAVDDDTFQNVFRRIKRALTNGITLGDRHYEFLAFGNSQFREHGAYFFASTSWLTAADMRKDMGNLDGIRIIAKWASRLGQNFSTTRAINGTKVKIVKGPDVVRNEYCFTDGVGKISTFLGQMIAAEFGLPDSIQEMPSLFQFRLGGCKGVLAVDPDLPAREIMIRESQYKFGARHEGLEIIRVSSFATAILNRQLIVVLSTLGVPDDVFLTKVHAELDALSLSMTNDQRALEMLRKNIDFNQTTLTIASMVLDGFMAAKDPFLMSVLQLWRAWNIKFLKEKARIPVHDGAFVLGCVDETGTLEGYRNGASRLPEIFLQINSPASRGTYKVVQGICILARNPSLHPGDIRVVRAVDVPALHHLRNVVVLPQRGDRPLANMCSGGDLDGDDYFVSWDPLLLPSESNHEAMDYTAPGPVCVDRNVTIDDAIDFFVTYMKNDSLPRIAHAHLATADFSSEGVKDQNCEFRIVSE